MGEEWKLMKGGNDVEVKGEEGKGKDWELKGREVKGREGMGWVTKRLGKGEEWKLMKGRKWKWREGGVRVERVRKVGGMEDDEGGMKGKRREKVGDERVRKGWGKGS